jgi:hypothetical protein
MEESWLPGASGARHRDDNTMSKQSRLAMGPVPPQPLPLEQRLLRWAGRFMHLVAFAGLLTFGAYIALRATGATFRNFEQWRELAGGLPMPDASTWIANLGIGMHFVMGTILVLAWPILLSTRIRARHRVVHRWTGRVYVSAGLLAGVGGLSFIFTHGAYTPSASVAFGIWGTVMMLCATMAYMHARAKRFALHRAWAIRLFAMVLGSWLFDIEFRAWKDLTGGAGIGAGTDSGPFDYAILYLFFVPNLLVAEFFVRNKHRQLALPRKLTWAALIALAVAGLVFAYAVVTVSATRGGKFGTHLLQLIAS